MMKNCMFDIKKCSQEFGMLELGVRGKIIYALPDASDGLERPVWDVGYPQNQTG